MDGSFFGGNHADWTSNGKKMSRLWPYFVAPIDGQALLPWNGLAVGVVVVVAVEAVCQRFARDLNLVTAEFGTDVQGLTWDGARKLVENLTKFGEF